jgi:hypothetical protein
MSSEDLGQIRGRIGESYDDLFIFEAILIGKAQQLYGAALSLLPHEMEKASVQEALADLRSLVRIILDVHQKYGTSSPLLPMALTMFTKKHVETVQMVLAPYRAMLESQKNDKHCQGELFVLDVLDKKLEARFKTHEKYHNDIYEVLRVFGVRSDEEAEKR